VVSLGKYAAVYTRSWAGRLLESSSPIPSRTRDPYQEENALSREELRIKDARMASIPAHHRHSSVPPSVWRSWNLRRPAAGRWNRRRIDFSFAPRRSPQEPGEDGGLYGGGENDPLKAHQAAARKETSKIVPLDAEGKRSGDGKIVVIFHQYV
jgi:hypothetical protein